MRSLCGMRFRSLANFVGIVVGFLNVSVIRLRSLLLAAALSFESKMVPHFIYHLSKQKNRYNPQNNILKKVYHRIKNA